MILLFSLILLCKGTNLFGGFYEKPLIKIPCYNNLYCNKFSYCQYYILLPDKTILEIPNNNNIYHNKIYYDKLCNSNKKNLRYNSTLLCNSTRQLSYTISNYCKCKDNYYTTIKSEICNYKRKSKKKALILQTVLFPLGLGTYYLGWYILGLITSILFILCMYHLFKKNKNYFIFLSIIWFILWVFGLILIINYTYDINGVMAI